MADVIRTRLFVTCIERDWEAIGRAHAERLGTVRPATSMVEVSRLIEPWMLVEIEADAVAGSGKQAAVVVVAGEPYVNRPARPVRPGRRAARRERHRPPRR